LLEASSVREDVEPMGARRIDFVCLERDATEERSVAAEPAGAAQDYELLVHGGLTLAAAR
jgi:hypothetical protein